MYRASCLLALIAAIAAWNPVYLATAVETLRTRGVTITGDIPTTKGGC